MALAAEKGAKTLAEPAVHFDVKANTMMVWWDQLLEGAAGFFGNGKPAAPPPVDVKERRARIEVLTLRNESLAGALTKAGLLNAKG